MKGKAKKLSIKSLGFLATILGIGVSMLSDWIDDKKLDEKIDEKVNEKVNEMLDQRDDEES